MSSKNDDIGPERRLRGRPRVSVQKDALEAATCVFWSEGYEAASVDQLCRAMKMPRASLYQAFGDKEHLFLAAINHYGDTRVRPLAAALGPTGSLRQDLEAFFESVVDLATSDAATSGCLISCVLSDAAGSNPLFRAELDRRYASMESWIAERLGMDAGPLSCAPEVMALVLASVARGLTLRARSGATAAVLKPVARAAALAFVQPAAV